ncbi:MAG TPA: hypothetical protein VFC67_13090 [Prolixibacteraceae bacterium]|nr:hypothetical protein [Prolixibacteraceae bacterium]
MRRLSKLKYILSFSVFFLSLFLVNGQEINVKTALEHDSIWLGDQIKLLIVVEQTAGTKVEFPQLPDSILKVEILNKSKIDTSKLEGTRLQLKQTYLVTCFDSGAHYIPPFVFKVRKEGSIDSLKSNNLTLFVKMPPVDLKKGPVDIKKPFSAPVTLKEIAPWLLGIILIGAIVFLIIYAISRRNKNKPLFQRPPKPRIPAHLIALQELDKLKGEELWQHEKVKDYYTRLTDIVRVYIEERFTIAAMEQTSFEILTSFKTKESQVDPKSVVELKEILEVADLVKFAKFTPLPDENHRMLSNAYLFVKETTVEVVTEVPKPAEVKVKEVVKVDISDIKGEGKL